MVFLVGGGLQYPLLSMACGANGLNDLTIVVLRAQQTLMGVVTCTLVWILIWPASSRSSLETATQTLLSTLHDLFGHHLSRAIDRPDERDAQALRRQAPAPLRRPPKEQEPVPELKVQQVALASLPHFDRAAMRLPRDRLLEVDHLTQDLVTQGENESLYRLLGSYRAVAESLIDLSGRAAGIDWNRLGEARF